MALQQRHLLVACMLFGYVHFQEGNEGNEGIEVGCLPNVNSRVARFYPKYDRIFAYIIITIF